MYDMFASVPEFDRVDSTVHGLWQDVLIVLRTRDYGFCVSLAIFYSERW